MTKRQPKGTPVGGQFAQERKPDGGDLVPPRKGSVVDTAPWGQDELVKTKVFFAKRVAEMNRREPDYAYRWYSLDQKLVGYGGVAAVPPVEPEMDLDVLLESGRLFISSPVVEKGDPNQCHANIAQLWTNEEIDAIYTGYALSDDGLWRQHSWGFRGESLIETTDPRVAYFGFEVPDSDQWSTSQL